MTEQKKYRKFIRKNKDVGQFSPNDTFSEQNKQQE